MASTKVSASSLYRFKDITTIPEAKDLVDIVLSQTQRRTPTQVHPQFKISRIRNFYMRKVKYCQQTFHDKFTSMLSEFPRLDDIHPFYADLCNVLYDRDHYKLALGQVNAVRGIVDHIAKDYVRLLKYADSPYKCKMLKRAALGRMCTAVRKLNDSLKYLEEVRQHLSRLPSINPNTRTLILAGYPNVGKSSFINSITHANVEVQPYAFTTKSLFVGHFDFNYSRWQVIDTPGILDHPLANRNTIELTAITALAHIQAAVLFFIDISEQCGFSIECQVSLFHSIKVLFKNKPIVIILNKVDVVRFQDLTVDKQNLIQSMTNDLPDVVALETSCLTSEGLDIAKNKGCDMLLTRRVEAKLSANRAEAIANRLHVTPVTIPDSRPPHIPHSVLKQRQLYTSNQLEDIDDNSFRLSRDIEEENGGAGVFSIDLNSEWKLKNEEWKYDIIPDIYAGKNIVDFIDPDIEDKLKELEAEEALLLQEDASMKIDESDWLETSKILQTMHKKIELQRIENRLRENHAHRIMPKTSKPPTPLSEAKKNLSLIGYQVNNTLSIPNSNKISRITKQTRFTDIPTSEDEDEFTDEEDIAMKGEHDSNKQLSRRTKQTGASAIKKKLSTLSRARTKCFGITPFSDSVKRARHSMPNRLTQGIPDPILRKTADKTRIKREAGMKRMRKAGEADRFIGTLKPKHLYSGKRGIGKTDRR